MASSQTIRDLSACEPAYALSRRPWCDQWGTYEYETAEGAGVAVYCRPHFDPPPLRLDLRSTGRHRIFLGIHYGHTHDSHAAKLGAAGPDQFLWAKLTGDRAWDLVEAEYFGTKDRAPAQPAFGSADAVEVLWREADLTGQSLHIAPRRTARFPGPAAGLAWVRLEPVLTHGVPSRARPPGTDAARLIYVGDADLHEAWLTAPGDVHRLLDPLAGSDFGLVCWATSWGDVCFFASERHPRALLLEGLESPYGYVPEPPEPGFDVLQTVADTCHELGLRVHGTMRPAASRMPPLHWPRAQADLFHDHPEVRQAGRGGEPVGHYCFSHPLVRATLVNVLREQVSGWPLDGVHLLLNRGWPFVGFGEHVVRDFVAAYGEDPRALDPRDPRLWRHRARYMDAFIGAVRAMLDEVGAEQDRRLALSVTVMAGVEQCLSLGLDVAHWLRAGWLTELIVHPCWLPDRWLDTDVRAQLSVTAERIREVAELARGTGCRVHADVYPRYLAATEYPGRAREYYDAGADGLCLWDTYCRMPRKSEWNAVRRLGHIDELERLAEDATGWRRVVPLISAAGMGLDPTHTPATNG